MFAPVLVSIAGKVPYSDHRFESYAQLAVQVSSGGARPEPPADMPAPLVALMRACWSHDPDDRPSAMHVLSRLRDVKDDMTSEPVEEYFVTPLVPATTKRAAKGVCCGTAAEQMCIGMSDC